MEGYWGSDLRPDPVHLTLSAVSYLEVLQGMRNKAEFVAVQKMLQRRQAIMLPVTRRSRSGPSS
jgi:hypothetical protein